MTQLLSSRKVSAMQMSGYSAKRYGYKRARATASPDDRITYLYDAVGLTPAYTNLSTGEFVPGGWGSIIEELCRPVMKLTSGGIDYELSRTDFTKKADGVTASDVANTSYAGDCFIEFRKYIWVYRYSDATYDYVIFSNVQYDENYKAYACTDEDGNVQDSFLWGAFKGSNISNKLRSLGTGSVMVNQTRNTEVSYAQANGDYYYTIYKSGWDFIGDWLTLISKSDNGQTKFGRGRADTSSASACGTLKDKPMFWGSSAGTNDVKVFGIEGFWGNVWEGMAGLVYNGNIKTKMVPTYNFDGSGYNDTGLDPSGTSGGYVSTAQSYTDQGYVPQVASGSETQYYCDGLWYNNSRIDYAFVGGSYNDAGRAGPRDVHLDQSASAAYPFFGSRLSFVGPLT